MNQILLLTTTNESNPMNHRQHHAIRVLGSICLFLLTLALPARAQEELRDFPLGPIGGIYHVTGGSSLARITSLTAGEPGAMAGLQVNDYIYGAFGQVFTPTGGYHYGVSQELGFAVDRAEGADGVLPLMIMRAGTGPLTINVNLTAAGAFGVAYPRNSAKHAAVYETAIAYLHTSAINGNGNVGYPTGWTGLALLGHPNWNSTTGAKPYRLSINLIRDLVIGQLNAWPYAPCENLLLPSVAGQANGGDNPNHVGGASNWELGQKVMFLAEYYAKTSALNESDKATVAAALQRGAEMCGNSIQWWKQPSQTGVGGFSPEYASVAGMCSHGGVTGDYMHQGWYCGLNITGVYSFNGMAFSRRAGVDMTARPKDGHYFGYTLTQGDPIPAGATNALPASITLPQYGADPQRGSTITDPFWYDPSVHQKFVMQLNFLARRSTWYDTSNPLTGEDGMVGYAPEAITSYDAGGRTPGTLLGMAMYHQDVGGLDSADLTRLESLKGYISRNYMQHQEAHAYCIGAQVYQALATSYLSDRQQRFFMDNWRFFFALSRTNTNGFQYFAARTVWDNYLDTTLCAALNIALPYAIANGNYSLIPGYNTTRTLANFKSPALLWPSIEARTCTVRTSSQAFQTDVCDGNGNVLAPATYTAAWSHVSGPATATFSPNNTANTTVTLPSVSATPYRIRLTVTRAGFPTLTEDIDVTRANPDSVIAASISTQPVAQTTVPGGSASFSVALTGSGPFLYQWQLDGVPCWGTSTSPTLNLTNLGSGAVGSYRCVVTTPSGTLISNSVPLTINSTLVRTPGGLRREVWNGIGGTTIADLTSIASFPRFPSLSGVVASAEGSTDYSDNYGQKLSGWIKPPATGKYKFFLTSNDASQLWLSTNDSASNKVKIADLPYAVGFRAYSSGAQSVWIDLVAGQKYYLEILQKDGTGGDHLSVAWQLPGEAAPATNSAPIDGIYLECDQYQPLLTNHWKLDEASGSACADSVGATTVTLYNSPVRVAGILNGAVTFNGTTQYARTYVDVSETNGAVSLWFRTTQSSSGLFSVTEDGYSTDRQIYLSGGNVCARIWSDQTISSTGQNYADGNWHHVVHTYGGSLAGQRIYVDGLEVASGSKSQSDFTWQTTIHIGYASDSPAPYFNGTIDDVRIYNAAFSVQDAAALYIAGFNNAPVVQSNTFTVAEYSPVGTTVGTVTATDPNAGQTLTYSLVGGNVGNRFAINPVTGVITTTGPLVISNIPTYVLTIRVTDNGSPSMSADGLATVNLSNVNEAPVFPLDPIDMNGLQDVAFSGALTATDPDVGDTLTYQKISGPSWLTVAANGALSGTPLAAHLGSNAFTVRVTDGGGLWDEATLDIMVTATVAGNALWTGSGATSNWSVANWSGSNLIAGAVPIFGSGAKTAPVNDFAAGTYFGGLQFNATAPAFTLTGNAISLTGAVANSSINLQTVNMPLVLASGSGGFAVSDSAGILKIGADISGSRRVTKSGAGSLALAASNSHSGGTLVAQGTLSLQAANALGTGAVENHGALVFNTTGTSTWAPVITGAGSIQTYNAMTFNGGSIQQDGGLYCNGATTFSNTPATFGGDFKITGGSNTVTIQAGAAVSIAGSSWLASINTNLRSKLVISGGSLTIAGAARDNRDSWFDVTQSGGVVSFGALYANQTESGNGGGTGGNSTYTLTGGQWLIGEVWGGGGGSWDRGIGLNLGGGTLTVTKSSTFFANSVNLTGINGNVTLDTGSFTLGSAYAMSGPGGLIKAGSGTLVLSVANNSYAGGSVINAGTVQTDIANALPAAGAVTLANAAGAMLNLNGYDQTIGTLAGGGTNGGNISLGAATLTVSQTGSGTFGGVISGTGGFSKGGSGTLTLSGSNAYAGATAVNAGTLLVNGTSAGVGAVSVAATATLGGSGSIAAAVTNSGTLAPGSGGAGNLTINNALTLAPGCALAWQVSDWTGAAGTGYDKLTVGSLAITATAANPVVIRISEQALVNFAITNTTFTLIQSSGAIVGFDSTKFVMDRTGFTSPAGIWSIQQSGNTLVLVYNGSNTPPTFGANPIGFTAVVNAAFTGQLTATDADGDTLVYDKLTGPAWLNVSGTGTLSGTPLAGNSGSNSFIVRVADGQGNSEIKQMTIAVYPSNSYGTLSGTSTSEYINRVVLGGIDNTSGNNSGYANFKTLIAQVTPGATVAYTLTPGFASTTRSEAWTVWIDLNRDGDFTDTGENVLQTAASTAARSGNITIPATASVGPSRMRIAMKRTSAQTSPTGTFSSGEVEDYSVQIGTNPTVNNAPYFLLDPIVMPALAQGSAMSGSLAGTAADWESQTLTYSKVSGPAWLQVASNGSLSGTPSNNDVGTGSYVVSVTDSLGATDTSALSIPVTNVNDAPVFIVDPITLAATEDTAFSGQLVATDVDAGDTLTYTMVTGPAWLTVSSAGALDGTPRNGDVGSNIFSVRVTDAANATVTATLNITVANVNDAPVFTVDPITLAATEDTAFSGQLAATDVDAGDKLTYTMVSGPSWLTVSSAGALGGTPLNADVGSNTFTVRVTDAGGLSSESTLNITVANVNDAPVFTSPTITGAAATQGTAYSGTLAGTATDVDAGDTLTYTKVSGPSWLAVAANGDLTGAPGTGDAGSNTFNVRVTDAAGLTADASLQIQVIATNPDANGNGILDAWESTHFGNADPGSNAATDDSDGDGISNLMEYALNTNPLLPNTIPLAGDFTVAGADSFLRLTGPRNPDATNLSYIIEVSSDLTPNSWTPIPTVATGNQVSGTDTVPTAASQRRFIHLKVIANP
jgi:autotransporter-associated beta strand protein